jgi:hypothetical protein
MSSLVLKLSSYSLLLAYGTYLWHAEGRELHPKPFGYCLGGKCEEGKVDVFKREIKDD